MTFLLAIPMAIPMAIAERYRPLHHSFRILFISSASVTPAHDTNCATAVRYLHQYKILIQSYCAVHRYFTAYKIQKNFVGDLGTPVMRVIDLNLAWHSYW